ALNGGGSYITLDPCGIESGTQGDYTIKAANFDYNGPARMSATHPEYPPSLFKQMLRLQVPQAPNTSGKGWMRMPYKLYADGALLKEGVLDGAGQLPVEHQVVTRQYRLELANGVKYQIPVPEDYRTPERGPLANRGLRKHRLQTDTGVSQPDSESDHRALYAAMMEGVSHQKGESQ
uniref:DUF2345 domain-containing protein n=1 Tax=Pseudomonas sp. MWU13-2100 TaxID=2935075 RepID=UPI00399C386F